MNIFIITYQGQLAGSTYSISYLAKGLADLGHKVIVGCPEGRLLSKLLKDTKVIVEPMIFKGKIDPNTIRHIKQIVEKYNIELINAQSSKDRYSTIFMKWWYKLPVVLVHTRRQNPLSEGGFLKRLFYTKGTDKIIVVSNSLKEVFVKKGFPNEHIKAIHNGIPDEFYQEYDKEKSENLYKEYNLEGKKVIGCVSRLKSQIQLVEALPHFEENVVVFFVGIEKGIFDKKANELGVQERIIYAGKVKDAVNYYPLFDVNVLASTMDGFGLVLVEAMGMGVPVIGTKAQGIEDVLADGRGLLFEDNNIKELTEKINLVLYDEEVRKELIEKGLYAAKNIFSIKNTILNYESYFQELINEKLKKTF